MTPDVPTDRELTALKVLWERKEATVREIFKEIYADRPDLAYTTVLSLMQVMEQKGLVGHKLIGKAYSYYPKVERASTFRRLAAGFLDKVFDGSLDEYVAHALQSRRTSAEEFKRLEQMIQEKKGETGSRGKKRRKK